MSKAPLQTIVSLLLLTVSIAHAQHGAASKEKSASDVIVLPAGTEIRVDIHESKVTVPVRSGFTTAIPALSPVTVRVDTSYVPPIPGEASYTGYTAVTEIIVKGTKYKVTTNSVPVTHSGGGEVTFTLQAPLSISR